MKELTQNLNLLKFYKIVKINLFTNFFVFNFVIAILEVLDPDLESAYLMQIQIQGAIFMRIHADTDPKHF